MPHKKHVNKKLQQAIEMRKALSEEYHEEKRSLNRSLVVVTIFIIVAILAALFLGFNLSR